MVADRLDILRAHVDVSKGRGLEIGPLANPIVTREMGKIFYVDHASTEDLRKKYKPDPGVDENKIVDVDFVWGDKSLAEAVGDAAPFDYVIASHVLEHSPNLIGWLEEIFGILRPGGRLSVALPDRRVTFDVRRRDSDISEVVEAHMLKLRRPSVRAIFDHFYRHVDVDCHAIWRGEKGYGDAPFNTDVALSLSKQGAENTMYVDTHCWVFSDETFVGLMGSLMKLGLVDARFLAFTPTRHNDYEFFATLERPTETDRDERLRRNLASLPDLSAAPKPGRPSSASAADSAPGEDKRDGFLSAVRRLMKRR